ncbi:MAG TPA: hypothetical protein DCZ95_13870 [Verrucomicrobia bacterium]|nr:hypothetical protein [Verrucomicrobiota bacterium]
MFRSGVKMIVAYLLALSWGLVPGTQAQEATNSFWPSPYAAEGWPAQHHDAHNSDWMPRQFAAFNPEETLEETAWWLRDTNNPVVCVGGGTIGCIGTNEYFVVTTGKIKYPNLYVLDMNDGRLYWQSAPSTNSVDPGPDFCALTIAPTIDQYGNLFMADSHYVYCYKLARQVPEGQYQPFAWRAVMPNLKVYNDLNQQWQPTSDPNAGITKGFPFMSFVLTPEVSNRYYFGGFTIEGEIYMFDPTNGALCAAAYLETNVIGAIDAEEEPCDPYEFAAHNMPLSPLPSNPIKFGIWATGSNTDDPDLDYFMNPCQLKAYLAAGTFGTGSMIANNPCMARDPTNAAKCRIYIAGRQSSESARFDINTNGTDGIVYRVDFDPSQSFSNRLTILNYVYTNPPTGQALFDGRMVDGTNTATSPDLSVNEKWLFAGNKNGLMHCFNAENGAIHWTFETGEMLGSPTTSQNPDSQGHFLFYAFGDYDPWVFQIDVETGEIVSNETEGLKARHLPYGEYITNHYWRTEPEYQTTFYTLGTETPWPRRAIGASIILAASNLAQMIYTVGWQRPNDPTEGLWVAPTHQVVLVLNPDHFWDYTNLSQTVQAGYIDTNGTSEVGFILSSFGYPRGVLFYGVQSCCMANFLNANNLMPAGMETLYMRPYGGLGLFRLPLYSFYLDLLPPQYTNDAMLLQWPRTTFTETYTLEQCDNLLSPSWSAVSPTDQWPIIGTAWTAMPPANAACYRVRSQP